MFMVTVTDPTNPACVSSSFVNVLFAPNPSLEVIPDSLVILCEGETQFYDVTTDANSIVWLNSSGDTLSMDEDFEIAAEEPGDYTVIASTNFGCSTSETITVEEAEIEEVIVTSLNGADFFCEEDQVVIIASTENVNLSDAEWQDANGNVIGQGDTLTIFPSETTTYFVSGTTDDGCVINGEYQAIFSPVSSLISGPDIICDNEDSTLSAVEIEGEDVTLEWQPADLIIGSNMGSTIDINPFETTTYTLTSTNADGCESVSSYLVSVLTIDEITITADPEEFFFGQNTQLMVTPNLPGYTYMWNPSEDLDDPTSPNPIVTPSQSGEQTYTVTITTSDGCVYEDSITLRVNEAPCRIEQFHVPNMFTPNGDGHNDIFEVYTNAIDDYTLIVFDRWGEEVFNSADANVRGWDGTFLGVDLVPDVYGYCVTVACADGPEFVKTGNITLMK